MKKKILTFLFALLFVIGGLLALNISTRHSLAICLPDPTGFAICPVPTPTPDSSVSSSAPGPNTAKLNPPGCNGLPARDWPCNGKFAGNIQPYFDIGNDTAYKYPTANIPIYLRENDIVDITITNASPDCQNTDGNTGLKEPDYNGNSTTGGPATTFSMTSQLFPTFQGPVTRGSTALCSNDVTFSGVHWWRGDTLTVGGQKVDANGVSNSGYDKVVFLHVSVPCPNKVNGQDCGASVEGENSFRVQITNSNPSGDSQISSGSDFTGYGYRQGNLSYGQHFTQEIVLGVDETCTNYQQKRSANIHYADMDANNSNWNSNIQMTLQRESWVNGNADGWTNWTNVPGGFLNTSNLQAAESGTFPTTSFDNTFRYRLLVQVVGVRNTIFFNVDGGISQISGKYHIGASECASFSCTPTPDPVDATKVNVTIKNNGPYPIGNGFQLRQKPDAQAWPATGFSANFTAGGTTSHTFTRPANVAETYTLYDGTGANSQVVPFTNGICGTSGSVTISCVAQPPNPAEIGQTGVFKFIFTIKNTTANSVTVTYTSDQGIPAGSLSSVSVPNPGSTTVAAGKTTNPPATVSISALMNYSSTLTVTATYPGDLIPTSCSNKVKVSALPYFQAWNGSVSAGGGFRSPISKSGACGGTSGSSSDPPYISPAVTGGTPDSGGIRAFGKQNAPNRGSRVDFGALALGYIIGSPGGPGGIYSGDSAASDRVDFANTLPSYFSGNMGGYLNSASDEHCVKDYYTDTQVKNDPVWPKSLPGDLSAYVNDCQNSGNRCQYNFNGTNLTNGTTVTIPEGMQITIYVDGDVTIDSNITYGSFDPTDQTKVPYFALIVRGNITLTDNVTQLNGLFVAQPKQSGANWTGGEFITCDDAAGNYCNHQLVVNGAVIAQHLQLLRNHGTLDNPPAADAGITGNPAEIFNFTPSMIIGNPAFAAQYGASPFSFSLPPVF